MPLAAACAAAALSAGSAAATSGGARFDPDARDAPERAIASPGAARFGQRIRRPPRRPALRFFHLRPDNLFLYGRAGRARFRIDSRVRHVRVTLVVRRRGGRRILRRIRLGRFRTRRAHRVR
ncbi:MAG: hypothetical protein WD649_00380, partial [Thermoleophilaceae bacterium]